MTSGASSYHHGDLPSALVRAARELLEEDGSNELSLRAVARRAGVSPTAPYRHFADRDALVSAVAAVGYQELGETLVAAAPNPATADDLGAIAVAYVTFALTRPGLFRAMFAEPCDPNSPERVAATAAMNDYVHWVVGQTISTPDPAAMATAVWALVHGLAFLHLYGKFDSDPAERERRIRAAVDATLAIRQGVD